MCSIDDSKPCVATGSSDELDNDTIVCSDEDLGVVYYRRKFSDIVNNIYILGRKFRKGSLSEIQIDGYIHNIIIMCDDVELLYPMIQAPYSYKYEVIDMIRDIKIFAYEFATNMGTTRRRDGLYSSITYLCQHVGSCIKSITYDSVCDSDTCSVIFSEYKAMLEVCNLQITSMLGILNSSVEQSKKMSSPNYYHSHSYLYRLATHCAFDLTMCEVANDLYDIGELPRFTNRSVVSEELGSLIDKFYDKFTESRAYIDSDSIVHEIYSQCVVFREMVIDRLNCEDDEYLSHIMITDASDYKEMERFVLLFWRMISVVRLTCNETEILNNIVRLESCSEFRKYILGIVKAVEQMKYTIECVLEELS
ncbi:MAG: hypothetical protein Gaeavirus17_8 [Gaeavirus sp.]|uniref:Uncharacterized protein n=1 Tax=Gaeavirus sp. TaxID=2487767 RepID=A0A3G4ZZA4_9VIRU|nr:MAG: hypothetical protein Gaeavirus17_8 [Gaeavirus sp.]